MMVITLITAILLPVYLYALIGTGVITLTFINCLTILAISALCVSLVLAVATLSTRRGN